MLLILGVTLHIIVSNVWDGFDEMKNFIDKMLEIRIGNYLYNLCKIRRKKLYITTSKDRHNWYIDKM